MKIKVIGVTLIIVLVLLVYNLFCYKFVNKMIDNQTRYEIINYVKNNLNNDDYEYIRATSNNDKSINVYILVNKKDYYHFILEKNNNYKILKVDQNIPVYIK